MCGDGRTRPGCLALLQPEVTCEHVCRGHVVIALKRICAWCRTAESGIVCTRSCPGASGSYPYPHDDTTFADALRPRCRHGGPEHHSKFSAWWRGRLLSARFRRRLRRSPPHHAPSARRADQCLEGCRHRRPVLQTLLPVIARGVFSGARWGVFLLCTSRRHRQRLLLRGSPDRHVQPVCRELRLTFMRLLRGIPELGGRVFSSCASPSSPASSS